jgi:excisionase family DNA binding protein
VPEVQIKTIEPLAVSPKVAAAALSITSRQIYFLIADGKLTARKLGSRTLIDYSSVTDFYKSLPAKIVAASIPNAPQSLPAPRRRRKAVRS